MAEKIDIGISDKAAPCFSCGVKLSGMQRRIHDLEIELSRATLENKRLSKIESRLKKARDKLETGKQKQFFEG